MRGFRDRRHGGEVLAPLVAQLGLADPVVLALPRGGVPVAEPVAIALGAPLDVYVARKIGAPFHQEYGIGAIAEDGEPVFNALALRDLRLEPRDLDATVRREREELARRVETYRAGRDLPALAGRDVVLVDDGLATGVTARAALRALRRHEPRTLVLAVPVASARTAEELRVEADHVVCALTSESLSAVGQFYDDFSTTTDQQVLSLTRRP